MNKTAKIEMVGRKFGLLTVVKEVEVRNKNGHILYEVICNCGNKKEVLGHSLRNLKSRACNKCQAKLKGTHGMWKSDEFNIWNAMKFRCDKKRKNIYPYKSYAGRGITVCKEWIDSFEVFYNDMGKRPSINHSIDRIDVNKGYYKENCRWATMKEQSRNKTNNNLLEYKGEIKCASEWCEIINMPSSTFYNRLNRGWSMEKVMSTPSRVLNKKIKD